jgi:hypothetical protein
LKYFVPVQLVEIAIPGWITAVATVVMVTRMGTKDESRKQGDATRDEPVARPQESPHEHARRRPSYASSVVQQRRVSSPMRIVHNLASKLTAEEEADLVERGLPERLVRNGNLDYASLTSGSMSDRIRNGCC